MATMTLIHDICTMTSGIAKDRRYLVTALQTITVAALVALTLVDVERDLGDSELWLAKAVPVVTAIGIVACLVARRRVMLTAIDAVVMVWWTAEAAMCYAGWGVFTPRAFWAFSEAVFLYAGLRLLFAARRFSGLWLSAALIAGCLYETALGLHQLFTDTSRHWLYPLTGTFLNPGPYSAWLAVGVAIALCLWQDKERQGNNDNENIAADRGRKSATCHALQSGSMTAGCGNTSKLSHTLHCAAKCLFVVLPLIMLPATCSRAAWVAVAVVAVCLYWRRLARYRFVVAAVLVVGGVAAYLLKQGSADGRMVMWLGALRAIAADPWTGAGIGGFGGAYAGGVAALFADGGAQGLLQAANVTDNAYNELLTIGVEQGLPGMTAMAAVTLTALVRLHRSYRPLMYGLLALVVFSMFSYPLHCQSYRIMFVMMCAWAASAGTRLPHSTGNGQAADGSKTRGMPAVTYSLLAIPLLAVSLIARADTERRVAASEDYRIMAGVDTTYLIDDYYELLPLMDDNADFLFDFGKALADLGRYNDSNAMLRRGTELSPDPMFLVVMGNNYRDMGLPDEAERCYQRAFSVMPNRIYPLYRLMKLYEGLGRQKDCLQMARRVAAFDEKVESQATREMKEEAEEIIKTGIVPNNHYHN